jgi:IS1 family transposase
MDTVFLELKALLEPFGITQFYTEGRGAYERHIDPEKHDVGKEQTQKIESKHINLRTRIKRLVRRTTGATAFTLTYGARSFANERVRCIRDVDEKPPGRARE